MASTLDTAKRWLATCCFAGFALVAGSSASAQVRDFRCTACDVKDSEVARCMRMDPDAYSTGLLFNTPGTRTSFDRSSCLQGRAVEYRDASLCDGVRERKSLFFDGSAISRESCLRRVREKLADTPREVIHDLLRPTTPGFFRNGNGRDMDVDIRFTGSFPARYAVSVSMVGEAGRVETLQQREHILTAGGRELRYLVRQQQVSDAADALALRPPYRFRVTVAMVDPSLRLVEQFAAMTPRERESSIDVVLDPAQLERDPRDFKPGG